VKNGIVQWRDLCRLAPPRVASELVVRQAMRACEEFLREELIKRFIDGSVPADPCEALTLELAVHRVCGQAADRFVHRFVEAAHQSGAFVDHVMGAALSRPSVYREGDREVPLTLLGGSTLRVQTPYVLTRRRRGLPRLQRGKEGNGSYPVLRQLGFLGRASPGLISEVAYRVASASIEEAHDDLTRRGLDVDLKTVRLLALKLGEQGLKARDALLRSVLVNPPAESTVRGLRLVVSTDGGKLKTRYGGKRGRRNAKTGRRRYHTEWVEPRVLAIHVIDDDGKKTRHDVGVLDASIADCNEVFRMLVAYLKLLGAHEAAQIVIVADGAVWIWDRVDELVRDVGIPPHRVKQVLDFYHVTEHLGKIAKLRSSWSDKTRKNWLRKVKELLWRGNVEAVLSECFLLCRGSRSKKIEAMLNYIARNVDRLNYPLFRKLKIPLGSGVIESAVRRIVNLRLKGPGIIWDEKNAEKVLHMRAQMKALAWQRFVINALNHHAAHSPQICATSALAVAM
jgi:hypothetical protein